MTRGDLLLLSLRLGRLPRLDAPGERPGFRGAAERVVAGDASDIPQPRLDFLRWLAVDHSVVFHGSPRSGITELSTQRESRDTTAFGNQAAVYASSDPVWALYFATLRRDNGWNGTRNGSIGRAGGSLYPRWYFFAHNREARPEGRFGPGTLYVLPSDGFEADPPMAGVLDTAHLVSRVSVRPLAAVTVDADDFPFRNRVGRYREREPIFVSMFRSSYSS